ncbi:MAG TPA: PEGA domain-containing protein [Polyangiaceae bacterium]|nr:PEGA domain-containing protein [Polyangiaceae bacterium]
MSTFLRWYLRASCLCALVCGWSGLAHADAAYDQAVAEALSELEANHYPEAREEFRRAHALLPSARTLRGLGMVEFELRNYGESVRLLEEALTADVKPLDDKLRKETEALLARAQRYMGELRVETDPSSATVIVDGAEMKRGPFGSLLLQVGEHALEVRAPGRASEKRVVHVRGGERSELRISLGVAGADQEAMAHGKRTDLAAPTPVYKKWWLWTTVAVLAVAGATTAAVLLTREPKTNTAAVDGTGGDGISLQTLRRF